MDRDELKKLYQAHLAELQASYGAALEAGGFAAVAIHSGWAAPATRFDDRHWPFRPTPFFQHWLPLHAPNAALVLAPGEKPKLLLPQTPDYWEQPPEPEVDFFWDHFEVVRTQRPDEVRYHLRGRVAFLGDDAAAA